MFNVCVNCGIYRADKDILPEGPVAVCPECGYRQPFKHLPLLVVGGASGTGKTSVSSRLAGSVQEAVFLETDILWRPEFDSPEDGYRDFFDLWLRMAKNINQSGRPVVLFGAGFGVPENLESSVERRYFTQVHYLALTCDDRLLEERLRRRPAWRGTGRSEFIAEQQRFNRWLKKTTGDPPITLLETTHASPEETAEEVGIWARKILAAT